MSKPIAELLDAVAWERTTPDISDEGEHALPWVTHEGVLEFCGLSIRVLQLSNGARVIPQEEMERLLYPAAAPQTEAGKGT